MKGFQLEINSNVNGVTRAAILQQSTVVIIFDICCYWHLNRLFYNTEDVKSLLLQQDTGQHIRQAAWIDTTHNWTGRGQRWQGGLVLALFAVPPTFCLSAGMTLMQLFKRKCNNTSVWGDDSLLCKVLPMQKSCWTAIVKNMTHRVTKRSYKIHRVALYLQAWQLQRIK